MPELVADLQPGQLQGGDPQELTVFDGRLFFVANSFFEGDELWWYNGTGVPQMVQDLLPGPGGSSPQYMVSTAVGLFMRANSGFSSSSLFVVKPTGTDPSQRPN